MLKAASAVSSIYWPVLSFEEQIDLLNDLSISLTNEFNSDTCDRCTPSHVQYGPDGQTCKEGAPVKCWRWLAQPRQRRVEQMVSSTTITITATTIECGSGGVPSVPISQSDRGADYLPR